MKSCALLLLAGAALIGGCAGASKNAAPAAAAPVTIDGAGLVLTALPDSGLPKGACGMILWTLDENRPAPVLRVLAGQGAEIGIGGGAVALTREAAEGQNAFGVAERQRFVSASGHVVRVEARFGTSFDGGAYLERGRIAVETPDGWRTVAPAAGLAGCRAG